jgi:hypothetical protein
VIGADTHSALDAEANELIASLYRSLLASISNDRPFDPSQG